MAQAGRWLFVVAVFLHTSCMSMKALARTTTTPQHSTQFQLFPMIQARYLNASQGDRICYVHLHIDICIAYHICMRNTVGHGDLGSDAHCPSPSMPGS